MKGNKGVTLVEILVVLSIVAISLGVFHMVFITNWFAFQERITRTNLWHEANEITETLTNDGRSARQIDIINEVDGSQSVTLFNTFDEVIARYVLTPEGQLQIERGDEDPQVLSSSIRFVDSQFIDTGDEGLQFDLALEELVFTRMISIQISAEVFPRN